MPVSVRDYLDSMKSVSASQVNKSEQSSLKTQALLSSLIETISYANSMDFRKKTLNKEVGTDGKTVKQIIDSIKSQEKLVSELAKGQQLTNEQNKELRDTIDKFYEIAKAQEVNYKKYAASLEKFALQDLPEAVQNRLINDSRDAHIIGKEQKDKEGLILPIIKRIRNLLEDSAETTKQFSKKLFVKFDMFKEALFSGFEDLKDLFDRGGGFLDGLLDTLSTLGMAGMFLQGQFKDGKFGFGQIFKQLLNFNLIGKNLQKPMAEMLSKAFGGVMKSLGGTLAKFGVKGAENIVKVGAKGSKFLKKVPLLGTLISIWMGVERWKQKDYAGALIEFGSGVAAAFPGVGTIVSIALDLVNLAKDKGMFKAAGDKAKNALSNVSENVMLSIPVIGPIFGITKAIQMNKAGDKAGALKMCGKALASILPGGAMIADMLFSMSENDKDVSSSNNSSPSAKKKSWWPFGDGPQGEGPFGDGPIQWKNESGGYSPKGLTNSAKNATENFNKLIGGNLTVTSAFRDPSKMMAEWNAATPIPNSRNRRNRWGNEMADPRRSHHAKGWAVDVPMSLMNKLGKGKFSKLAKQAGFSMVYPEKTAVHLEVPPNGTVKANTKGMATGASGEVLNENDQAMQSVSTEVASAEAETPDTFEGIMEAFKKFNEEIVAGVQSSASTSTGASATEAVSAPKPVGAAPSAPAHTTAPKQQVVQTVSGTSSPDTMDKEIQDTDLALINSLLFQS